MGSQFLDKKTGQPILTEKKCPHGVFCDERGNNACELCLEDGRNESFRCGIWSGLKQAADGVRFQSGNFFAKGDDTNARMYRLIADDLDKAAKKAEEEYRAYQKRVEDGDE